MFCPPVIRGLYFFTLKQYSVRFMHGRRPLFVVHRFTLTPKINVLRTICETSFDLWSEVEATQDGTLDDMGNIWDIHCVMSFHFTLTSHNYMDTKHCKNLTPLLMGYIQSLPMWYLKLPLYTNFPCFEYNSTWHAKPIISTSVIDNI